ncbi:hypothetical protein B0T17DRAFT_625954 [Bombardia bombarda]|uniref:Tat pathway signal sequence n=1 Tax=Bombardia bombarda TaxID=252184 RepID=A0AA39XNR7_9PEZI|nr:hypothetical protein B0T17DRAFT_625954 [Bombardia bombarda]
MSEKDPFDVLEDQDFKDSDSTASTVQDSLLHGDSTLLTTEIRNRQRRRRLYLAAAFHTVFVLILGIVWLLITRNVDRRDTYGVNLIQGPIKDIVEFERVTLDNNLEVETPFKGDPSPEIDAAWDGLVQYEKLAIPASHLLPGQSSIPLNDHSDRVIVSLDVFHDLYCLDYVRRYIFRSSYYNESFPEDKREEQKGHVAHCVDMIRQSLTCHGDLAINTFDWVATRRLPFPDFRIDHECRKWDGILGWAGRYKVEEGELVNPAFGG